MVVINRGEYCAGDTIRKKVGVSPYFGRKERGQSRYGDEELILGRALYGYAQFGVDSYAHARSPYGVFQVDTQGPKQQVLRQEFYIPSNPRTVPQQAQRTKMANAILAWQGLTTEQKNVYNENAKYKKLSGYNLFLKGYLLSN